MKLAVLGLNLLFPLALFGADPTSAPVVSTPFWNQQDTRDKVVSDMVKEVPAAVAHATAARYTYYQDNQQLNRLVDRIRDDFYTSKEYVEASNEVKQAYADYNKVRDKVTESVRNNDNYKAVTDIRSSLSDQLLDEHSVKDPNQEKLVAIAELRQKLLSPFRQEEIKLLAGNKEVADAKDKLMKANDKLVKLEADFKLKYRDNTEVAAAIQKRADSRLDLLVSSAYVTEVENARDIILKYSQPVRSNYSPYPYGVFGGGYGYGFGNYGVGFVPNYIRGYR